MSQFFSFSRFGRLFGKHTAEHGRGYLLGTGVVLGLVALWLGSNVNGSADEPLPVGNQIGAFVAGLGMAGLLFTSTVFGAYGDKRQATAALMLPASTWEKYLVGWCYALPVFLAVYVAGFYLVDATVLHVAAGPGKVTRLMPLFSQKDKLYYLLIGYAVLSSGFLWGSIYFQKQQFIRTAFAGLLGGVALALANSLLAKALVAPGLNMVMPFSGVNFQEGGEWYHVTLPAHYNGWVPWLFLALMLLCWAGAYARLKEKEV
ncbi:hypothetical protein MUN81_06525 [Hymenobacter sp. 5317J-9]|uniref:hypothetical protein n=1 Tax=Hymenobacter sp. 5317J-9 TaxID=2932250 RepID=UPI001FD64684|nr:hypothetical protein [Hymenobacter sp. 5317J-9]UOQ99143.1 hypothetical protein MUN81_06525 [Hymenobacter sp. 5317J-9]